MELRHVAELDLPLERAWELFEDVELVAAFLPGATAVDGDPDQCHGTLAVRFGPVTVRYEGEVRAVERDRRARRLVFEVTGAELDGIGEVHASITVTLVDAGGRSRALVRSELSATGRAAQYGPQVLTDVGDRLLAGLAARLRDAVVPEELMLTGGGDAEPPPRSEDVVWREGPASAAEGDDEEEEPLLRWSPADPLPPRQAPVVPLPHLGSDAELDDDQDAFGLTDHLDWGAAPDDADVRGAAPDADWEPSGDEREHDDPRGREQVDDEFVDAGAAEHEAVDPQPHEGDDGVPAGDRPPHQEPADGVSAAATSTAHAEPGPDPGRAGPPPRPVAARASEVPADGRLVWNPAPRPATEQAAGERVGGPFDWTHPANEPSPPSPAPAPLADPTATKPDVRRTDPPEPKPHESGASAPEPPADDPRRRRTLSARVSPARRRPTVVSGATPPTAPAPPGPPFGDVAPGGGGAGDREVLTWPVPDRTASAAPEDVPAPAASKADAAPGTGTVVPGPDVEPGAAVAGPPPAAIADLAHEARAEPPTAIPAAGSPPPGPAAPAPGPGPTPPGGTTTRSSLPPPPPPPVRATAPPVDTPRASTLPPPPPRPPSATSTTRPLAPPTPEPLSSSGAEPRREAAAEPPLPASPAPDVTLEPPAATPVPEVDDGPPGPASPRQQAPVAAGRSVDVLRAPTSRAEGGLAQRAMPVAVALAVLWVLRRLFGSSRR